MTTSLIGRMLGNYKVIELLGQGGMATVYVGYQEAVDRRVAIKVLPPHPGLDDQFIERFQIEARTIARLQHPHILPLYDYGNADDILYLVMAYVEGGTLDDRIAQGPLPVRAVEKTLREMASALDYAHRHGVIHRDIKPGNILLDSEGHSLLADFGIAKISGSGNLTGTGVVGTPAYMAPEQAQGDPIDSRADIYSLGVVVYQMLTGRQPYTAETPMQTLIKVIQDPVPDIREVVDGLPDALSAVMKKVMAKNPKDRYQTPVEFAEDFSRAVHKSDDSLVAARRAQPLGDEQPTAIQTKPAREFPGMTREGETQTIIVQQGANPLILLGGFAIIAAVIVAVVVVILGGTGGDGDADGVAGAQSATQTAAAAALVATQSAVPTATPEPTAIPVQTFGRLSYSTVNSLGDSVTLQVQNLQPVASGNKYVAWLVNTQDNSSLNLGDVVVDPLGSGALSYTDGEGRILAALFNALLISVEPAGSSGEAPSGQVRYSGSVPVETLALLYATFIASEDGLSGGSLLAGARAEARVAAQHAGLAAGATNVGGLRTHAEHTINILRGENIDRDGNGSTSNPGRGVGVYFFMDKIEEHLDAALAAPGASRSLEENGEYIRVCLDNTRQRADRVAELEFELIASESVEAVQPQAAESTSIAGSIQTGFDLNENGIVEPFEGECGLDQIETFALLVASLEVVAGAPQVPGSGD